MLALLQYYGLCFTVVRIHKNTKIRSRIIQYHWDYIQNNGYSANETNHIQELQIYRHESGN